MSLNIHEGNPSATAPQESFTFDPRRLPLIQSVLKILSGLPEEPLEITDENVDGVAATIETLNALQLG